jgi:septum formation topological specificity factor MinE
VEAIYLVCGARSPQLKRNPLGGPMKVRSLTRSQALELVAELRGSATLPPGPAPQDLRRAKEIRFLLKSQSTSSQYLHEKADRAYELIQVLLSHRRWRQYPTGLEQLRKDIKSACDRLRVAVVGSPRKKGAA